MPLEILPPPPGALYPVCVVKGELPETLFKNELIGVSVKVVEHSGVRYSIFPFWHALRLVAIAGEPESAFGKDQVAALRAEQQAFAEIDAGTHPLLAMAPPFFYPHQKAAFARMMVSTTGGVFHEPGLGKTATMLEVMRRRPMQTLVICPKPAIRMTWLPEIAMRAPELTSLNLSEDADYRAMFAHTYFLNREKLVYRREEYKHNLRPRIQRVVFDESSDLKTVDSQITSAVVEDWGMVPERYVMTGTPNPNGDHQFWGQLAFIRPGLLPLTPAEFRRTWFAAGRSDKSWKPKAGARETLMPRIRECCVFTPKEVLGLPEKNFIPRMIQLPTAPRNIAEAYRTLSEEVERDVRAAIAGGRKLSRMSKEFARIIKLRELCCGYMVQDGHWNLVSKHKFEALDAILEEIGPRQVTIWCNFLADFEYASKLLPHRFRNAGVINGTTPDPAYRERVVRGFVNGDIQYLWLNPRSMKYSVTLFDPQREQQCNNAVYFNLDYDLEAFDQSQDRHHRIGLRHRMNYWIPMCENTVETKIYERLREKRDDADDSLEFLKGA